MSVRNDTVNLLVNINGNVAQNNLNSLRKKAADIRLEIDGLKKGTAEYTAKAAELKKVTADMDTLKKSMGLAAFSQKELTAELKKLTALKGSMVPFSKEFNDLQQQIEAVSGRLNDVRNRVQGFSSLFSKVTDNIKQFGVVAAGYLGFQFLTSQFTNIIKGAGKLSDQLADLRRVAGLTADEAENLNNKFNKLDTRTSAEGLREIAIIAGKLGVAKGDIFEFTKSVDQLVVSLGDELGNADQITTQLGKILNVFDGKITGENISKLGNSFVELANTGAATGGFIADFDQRLSGIAKSAGISLGALSGLGAGIEEMGGRVESSSTAIQKLIISISSDIPKAAKIAGETEADFKSLFAIDPTEALLRYSQGLVKNKTSFAEVTASFKDAGEEGARTIETILKLGTGAEQLRGRIDLGKKSIQETSAITAAFNLKNETLGATLEKLTNEFTKLGNSPGVTGFLKGAIETAFSFVKAILSIPAPILKLVGNFALLVAGIALFNSSLIVSARLSIIQAAKTLFITVASYAAAAAITVQRLAMSASIATQAAFMTVTNLLTGAINLSTAATRIWSIALKTGLGPLGLLITAVGAIAAGVSFLSDSFKGSNKQYEIFIETSKLANSEISKEKSEITSLTAVISDHSISLETRRSSLQKLIELSPEYLSRLTLENIATDEGKKILLAYNTALEANANIKAASAVKEKEFENNIRLRSLKQELEIAQKLGKGYADLSDEAKEAFSKITTSVGRTNLTSTLFNSSISKEDYKEAFKTIDSQIKESTTNVNAATDNYVQKTKEQSAARRGFLANEVVAARQAFDLTIKGSEEYKKAYEKLQEAVKKYQNEFGAKSNLQKLPGELAAGASNTIEGIKNKIKVLDELFEKIDISNKSAIASNRANRKELQQQLDNLEGKKTPGEKKSANDYEKLKKEYEKFVTDIEKLKQKSDIKGEQPEQAEIDTVVAKYKELLAKAEDYHSKLHTSDQKYANEKLILTQAQEQEITNIQKKFFDSGSEQSYKDSLNEVADFLEQQKLQYAKAFSEGRVTEEEYQSLLTEVDKTGHEMRLKTAQNFAAYSKEAKKDEAKFAITLEDFLTQNIIKEFKKRKDLADRDAKAKAELGVLITKPGTDARYEAEKRKLKELHDLEMQQTDLTNQERLKKEAEYNNAVKDLAKQRTQEVVDQIQGYAEAFSQILSSINQIAANRENAQLQKDKADNDKKKQYYQKQLDSKLISKAVFDNKIQGLEEEQAQKEKQVKRKQAERDKALNLFNAIISTAAGIAKAIPNIPLMALAAFVGGFQIAAISNAPLPEFGTGKWVRDGDKHNDKSGGILAKIERDEAVMKADAMTNYKRFTVSGTTAQITSALNSAAGGVSWAGGAVIREMPWRSEAFRLNPDLPRIMEQGGIVRPLTLAKGTAKQVINRMDTDTDTGTLSKGTAKQVINRTATEELLQQLLIEQRTMREDMKQWQTKIKGEWVIKDLDETRNKYDAAKKASGF